MVAALTVEVPSHLFIRDPLDTPLGKRVVTGAIQLIDEGGFETFTFKKLASEVKTTEASVYRYFANKHQLLSYLVHWYWGWLALRYRLQTTGHYEAVRRLRIALSVLCEGNQRDDSIAHVNEATLHRIVLTHAAKARVKTTEKNLPSPLHGMQTFADILLGLIKEISPTYKNPRALSLAVIGAARQLLRVVETENEMLEPRFSKDTTEVVNFLEQFVLGMIGRFQ